MSLLTTPQARIPIGHVSIQGKIVPVILDMEWARYFSVLTDRAGGVQGVSTTELVESAYEDAGIAEQQAQIYELARSANQAPQVEFVQVEPLDNRAELRARIDSLESEIQALKQGSLI